MKSARKENQIKIYLLSISATSLSLLFTIVAAAQDGNAGINEANTKVRSYFAAGTNLMYAVGCHCRADWCCESVSEMEQRRP